MLPALRLPVMLVLEALPKLSPEPFTVSPLSPVEADGGSVLAIGPGMSRSERLRRERRSWPSAVMSDAEVEGLPVGICSADGLLREEVRLGMGRLDEFVLDRSRP